MRRIVAILFTLFLAIPAYADPASERLALGRQLVDAMGYRESYELTGRMCTHPEGSGWDPKALVEANRNALGGITPKSTYWPRMEAVFKAYRLSICRVVSADNMLEFVAGNFANRLSAQEMRAAITFYSTVEGRSLAHVLIAQNKETVARFEAATNANSQAYKEYATGLQRIIRDFQTSPD